MSNTKTVELTRQKVEKAVFNIRGISPLIMNSYDPVEIQAMEDKRAKKQKTNTDDRTPEDKATGKLYIFSDGKTVGFPAVGFKKSMVRAGLNLGYKMKQLQTQFFVSPDKDDSRLVKINGDWEILRECIPVSRGGLDIRYRPIFKEWSASVEVEYNANLLSYEQVAQLILEAGFACGIGDRRPERTPAGIFGRWEIE